MPAAKVNIKIEQGATFSLTRTHLASTGGAFNLTDYTPRGQLRKTFDASDSVSFTCAVNADPTTGIFTVSLTPTQTAALSIVPYIYDIEAEHTGGAVIRLLQGNAQVLPEVTRA